MATAFENNLMAYLASSSNADAKALHRWFKKNPQGRARKNVLERVEAQVNSILVADADSGGRSFQNKAPSDLEGVDWDVIFDLLGPFFKLFLAFLKLRG